MSGSPKELKVWSYSAVVIEFPGAGEAAVADIMRQSAVLAEDGFMSFGPNHVAMQPATGYSSTDAVTMLMGTLEALAENRG